MRARILVVDDSRTIRLQLQMLLGSQYDCEMFPCAEDALVRLAAEGAPPFDAVLLDVRMPGIDGLETLRRLRADPLHAGLPVLMVTTRGEEETVAKCRELGCDAFVTKPVQAADLFGALRVALQPRGAS